jgi:hypothetical protein
MGRAGECSHAILINSFMYLFIVTSAQLRSRCDVWLAVKASIWWQCIQGYTGLLVQQALPIYMVDCSHAVLVANRTKHRALFDGVSGVREWMAAAYKPEVAATLASCMQGMLHGLKAGLEGQPNVTLAS